ncbi:MAG: efflux RND transporter permease subunit [Candidatus Wallbacteria bacterium]|nr:efflux RND transporter permease subunit [Candidatus Wallbacteria bacterium]
MNILDIALRRPISVLVVVLGIALCSMLALQRMAVDIFPSLNLPVIYVAQTYGGMDPAQMEGYLVNYYEYHFLYIAGIEHVESRSIQNVGLVKLYFHPGTDMSQALAQTISYVERARAFMPTGTVAPFVMRFDAGSVPVGQLVFSSGTRGVGEIQDLALFRVRPMFATLPGVSAPPPFGGNQRTVVIHADPDKLREFGMAPEELVAAVADGNTIVPAGNVRTGQLNRIAPVNSVVADIQELKNLPIRKGAGPAVFLGDVATVENSTDILSGYALVNGRRTVYIPVTKRADASTLDVVARVKAALPSFQKLVPEDIKISFEFDQSVYVSNALKGLAGEGAIGALLTGLMVLLFLGDAWSALIVVLTIPFAVVTAVVLLWAAGQTINLMTLGGLALAIGILVDEAAVAIENVHTHLAPGQSAAQAAYDACQETMVPRFLAMVCILAVFIPSLFMVGIARSLFLPLALAVGCSMMASYALSSTFVPILAAWLLGSYHEHDEERTLFGRVRRVYAAITRRTIALRWFLISAYFAGIALGLWLLVPSLGRELFPELDTGQFQLRLRAPAGTRVEHTELIALDALDAINEEAGAGNVDISLGFVGTQPQTYPINSIYLWTSGPQEAVLLVALKKDAHLDVGEFRERLRRRLATRLPGILISFEAGDVVSQIMNFGAPAPIEVAVSGPNLKANRTFAGRVMQELKEEICLCDLQYSQPLDYPTVDIEVDRRRAGQLGTSMREIGRSLAAATGSSRLVQPNFWRDPASGVGYQVQIEVPQHRMSSIEDVESVPLAPGGSPRVGDVAQVRYGTMPGEYDRYNMQRMVTITANLTRLDLGAAATRVDAALKRAGEPPRGVSVALRGQVVPMRQTLEGFQTGLWIAFLAIFLLLTANFESVRLALSALSTIPAVLLGVAAMLRVTGTTLNVQSFTGSIMAIGVSAANAILLVTFSETRRKAGATAADAATDGAASRLRPILITSAAMIAGMIPMALALGEGGQQSAPLGRAVIGGLAASTLSVLTVLPGIFTILMGGARRKSSSVHPHDRDESTPRETE